MKVKKKQYDLLRSENNNTQEYGIIPTAVMVDPTLPLHAKVIFAYLCSCNVGPNALFPGHKTIMQDLQLSHDIYENGLQHLRNAGLIVGI